MNNKYKITWDSLKAVDRYKNQMIENQPGMLYKKDSLLPSSLHLLAFIGANPDTTITDIRNEVYFYNLSLSTIKRCVMELLECNAIRSTVSGDDRRHRHLNIIEVI